MVKVKVKKGKSVPLQDWSGPEGPRKLRFPDFMTTGQDGGKVVSLVFRVLLGKPEGKRPMGRPRRRWVDNIRMDLQEVGCGHMDCIGLAQDRDRWRKLVSAVMNLRVS